MTVAIGLFLPGLGCGSEAASPIATARPVAVAARPTATPAPDLFVTSVRPMLVKKCGPCHEPGGKLYGKLPFDNAAVVAAHAPGMSRRLKDEDRQTLEQWVATLPPAGS